jgi:hypothetical protein
VGLVAAITTWIAGIPMVQVGALVVSGALLIGLSRLKFDAANGMSASVAAAYRLLDRSSASRSMIEAQGAGTPR